MSIPVSTLDTTSLTTGQTGTISLKNVGMSAAPANYQTPPNIQFYNESGVGFLITFQQGGNSFFLPAGAWNTVPLTPGESGINWTVKYVLQNQPVAQLITVYFFPGENVPSVGTLGNSPLAISGAVQTTSVQTLQNDGNPANTQIIEATQSGGPASNVSIDNTGNMTLKQWVSSVQTTLVNILAGQANGNVNIHFSDANHGTQVEGFLNVLGVSNFDSGNLLTTGAGVLNFLASLNTLTGSTNGSLVYWQPTIGNLQIFIIKANAYRNATGVRQAITLPTAYQYGAFGWIGTILNTTGSSKCYFYNGGTGGTLLSVNQIGIGTGGNAGGFTVNTFAPTCNFFEINTAWDTIQFDGSLTANGSGWCIFIGR